MKKVVGVVRVGYKTQKYLFFIRRVVSGVEVWSELGPGCEVLEVVLKIPEKRHQVGAVVPLGK